MSNNKPQSSGNSIQSRAQSLEKLLGNKEKRAEKVNQMYDHQFGSHANSRHGSQTTVTQHELRVTKGIRPDGGNDPYVPRRSSIWESQTTQLAAYGQAYRNFDGNNVSKQPQPVQGNGNLSFDVNFGGQTGQSVERLGSVKNSSGTKNTTTFDAKVIFRKDGSLVTNYRQ